MNAQIVTYLQKNKEAYTKESLVGQLRKAGHSEADIVEAVAEVYGGDSIVPPPASDDAKVTTQGSVRYAGVWIRFVALLIDSVILFVCGSVIAVPTAIVFGSGFIYSIVTGAITVIYAAFMVSSEHQATLGKMAVGIKVCDAKTMGRVDRHAAFTREIVSVLLGLLTFYVGTIINAFVIGLSEKKRGIHDRTANTVVVYRN